MWTLFFAAGLLVALPQQAGVVAGATPQDVQSRVATMVANRPDPFELTLASPVLLPNGRRVGASVRPASSTEPWWVYTRGNLCQSVITHGPVPTDATDGWKVMVTERSRTTTQVMVSVTWLRMWERGRVVTTGSGGTSELTLQRSDRIPLDSVTRPSEPGVCAGTTKSLELQVGVTSANFQAPAGDSPIDGVVDAELWMVHQAPNGTETVEHQIVRLINGTISFAFRGGPVDTTDGPVALELSGQLKAVRREDGSRGLWAALARGVVRQTTATTSIAGPTTTTVGWLPPGEVVQFDLPPLQLYAGGAISARGGGGGGGGRGGTSGVMTGGQARSGGIGSVSGGGAGGGMVVASPTNPALPNLLEGHRLSLRVQLIETR